MTNQTKPITIKLYADPGHAWGAVKRKILEDLCILEQISPYSHQKDDTVYLEKNEDLYVLTHALCVLGIVYYYDKEYTDHKSPIRSYERFKAYPDCSKESFELR